jgi:hypothetical protein
MKSKLQLSADTLHVNAPSCSANPYSVTLNWIGSGSGWFVDISTNPNFSTFQNKNVSNLSSTSAPAGFSGGLTLYPDSTYYWRLWNGSSETYGTSFRVTDCNASPTNIQVNNPSCSNVPYSNTINWVGSGLGWWFDISTDSTFVSFSNKNVDNLTSTTAPAGFSSGLTLQPNTIYYWRMWNGTTWTYGKSFNVPICATGIQETDLNSEIFVYPSIGSGEFYVRAASNIQLKEMIVYNVIGEIVFRTNDSKIILSSQPNGIYFIQVKTEDATIAKKIIIQK